MSVATPRRPALTDRQPLGPLPTTLPMDFCSPTPKQRVQPPKPPSEVMRSQAKAKAAASAKSLATKRYREEDLDADANSKRCRVVNNAPNTPTRATRKDKGPVTPPDITVTAPQEAEALKESKRKQKHSKTARIERAKEINTFREKYTRVFPTFHFYFHGLDASLRKSLASGVTQLGAHVEDFFSSSVTHVISNRARPAPEEAEKLLNDKENVQCSSVQAVPSKPTSTRMAMGSALQSPIQLKNAGKQTVEADPPTYEPLILKAIQLKIKLWPSQKLDSMLQRLIPNVPSQVASLRRGPSIITTSTSNKSAVSLSKLLQDEKLSGVTHERDPNAKRPDYEYFGRNTYFLMVHDCQEQYAPVAIRDYGKWKKGDKPSWPVLNLDGVGYTNRSRAPVFGWKPELELPAKLAPPNRLKALQKEPQLRRSASMNALGRRRTLLNVEEPQKSTGRDDADWKRKIDASRPSVPSAAMSITSNASGMQSQGYIAASGNSAVITSHIASTTSTTGNLRLDGPTSAKLAAIGKRGLHQQVLTNRTFGKPGTTSAVHKENLPPPAPEPTRPHVIRKSKSTNTLRLPTREETKKPGYCENCRIKFEDFSRHVRSARHIRFANDESQFMELDDVLSRVRRKTVEEYQMEMDIDLGVSSSESESDSDSDSESEDEDEETLQADSIDEVQAAMEDWSDEGQTAHNSMEGQSDEEDEGDDEDEEGEDELALKGPSSQQTWSGKYTRPRVYEPESIDDLDAY